VQKELAARGHKAVIITPQPRGYQGDPPENVIFLGGSTDIKSPFHTTAQVSVTVNADRVDEVLAREQFDILHFHEPWVPIIGHQILARSTAVNVATFHAKLPDGIMSRTIERVIAPYTRSILKYIDALTAVSDPAAHWVGTMTDKPISLVPNGVDLKQFKPKAHEPNKQPIILYVGRLEKRKGVKYLLLAFERLRENVPNARLVILGDGSDREKLEELVAEREIEDVTFLGYAPDGVKLEWLQKADIFCSPALFGESFGIVLIEALACGTPIIAGSNPGYESVLTERGLSSLVNPKDTGDFARRLELFLADKEFVALWRKWAKDYVKQYDYPRVVDGYELVYKNALKEKS
jgi:phosphatidylinositol alpha-mannosyltransferase